MLQDLERSDDEDSEKEEEKQPSMFRQRSGILPSVPKAEDVPSDDDREDEDDPAVLARKLEAVDAQIKNFEKSEDPSRLRKLQQEAGDMSAEDFDEDNDDFSNIYIPSSKPINKATITTAATRYHQFNNDDDDSGKEETSLASENIDEMEFSVGKASESDSDQGF